jgi:hypothetical protein
MRDRASAQQPASVTTVLPHDGAIEREPGSTRDVCRDRRWASLVRCATLLRYVATVPEPASIMLLGTGLTHLIAVRCRHAIDDDAARR